MSKQAKDSTATAVEEEQGREYASWREDGETRKKKTQKAYKNAVKDLKGSELSTQGKGPRRETQIGPPKSKVTVYNVDVL